MVTERVIAGKVRRLDWRRGDLSTDGKTRRLMLVRKDFATPPVIDLEPQMPPVLDQGNLGSCASNMGCELMEFLERRGLEDPLLSRLFLYWYARKLEGVPPEEDSGSTIHSVIDALEQFGVCLESTWNYRDPDVRYQFEPAAEAVAEAAQRRALFAYYCPTVETIDASLAQGFPCGFGMDLPSNFESYECATTGLVFWDPKGGYVGGHAMAICGKSDTMKIGDEVGAYKVRNSWGEGFGLKGNVWIPKRFWREGIASECVTIRKAQL